MWLGWGCGWALGSWPTVLRLWDILAAGRRTSSSQVASATSTGNATCRTQLRVGPLAFHCRSKSHDQGQRQWGGVSHLQRSRGRMRRRQGTSDSIYDAVFHFPMPRACPHRCRGGEGMGVWWWLPCSLVWCTCEWCWVFFRSLKNRGSSESGDRTLIPSCKCTKPCSGPSHSFSSCLSL